ncbi:hypothetical protein ACFQRB_11760 [Halobaculum litoreum]|uniref:Uncharacterized protein n=1 Tax=Halobaculum litoreum TaxID=3031998 RepID=A0ABD5XTX4_9EURY
MVAELAAVLDPDRLPQFGVPDRRPVAVAAAELLVERLEDRHADPVAEAGERLLRRARGRRTGVLALVVAPPGVAHSRELDGLGA